MIFTPHFNSRAHVERDSLHSTSDEMVPNFNSRAHVERDGWERNGLGWITEFQLTRSRGARRSIHHISPCMQSISTHALTWSATTSCAWCGVKYRHFNSRAHVERDSKSCRHGPTATPFQLTRSRGARPAAYCHSAGSRAFQLTRSRGARHIVIPGSAAICVISTHALTWSATGGDLMECKDRLNFNSRAHVERDLRFPGF